MSIKIDVKGAEDLRKKLKSLEPKLAKKILRQTLRQASKTIQTEAKGNAPVDTGLTKRSIKVRAGKKKRNWIRLNVVIGQGDYKGETFYGAFQEYGTKKIKPKHFLKNAYQAKAQEVMDKAIADIKDIIETEASK